MGLKVLPVPRRAHPSVAIACRAARLLLQSAHLEHGDDVRARRKHTGSRQDAHETIVTAVEEICQDAGWPIVHLTIPIHTRNGKGGRGDLAMSDAQLGGHRHLILTPS